MLTHAGTSIARNASCIRVQVVRVNHPPVLRVMNRKPGESSRHSIVNTAVLWRMTAPGSCRVLCRLDLQRASSLESCQAGTVAVMVAVESCIVVSLFIVESWEGLKGCGFQAVRAAAACRTMADLFTVAPLAICSRHAAAYK